MNEGVVSKETVVLRRWGSSIQKFGFINGAIRSNEGLTLETSAFRVSVRWPIYIINSVDKTKFFQLMIDKGGRGIFLTNCILILCKVMGSKAFFV